MHIFVYRIPKPQEESISVRHVSPTATTTMGRLIFTRSKIEPFDDNQVLDSGRRSNFIEEETRKIKTFNLILHSLLFFTPLLLVIYCAASNMHSYTLLVNSLTTYWGINAINAIIGCFSTCKKVKSFIALNLIINLALVGALISVMVIALLLSTDYQFPVFYNNWISYSQFTTGTSPAISTIQDNLWCCGYNSYNDYPINYCNFGKFLFLLIFLLCIFSYF